ncbi:MAG: hypothetical protein AB1644_07195 [Candidatus Zixiibacteriota bacterium]
MMTALEKITSRRAWFVQDFVVWGVQGLGAIEFLALEQIDSTSSVLYGAADVGGGAQTVAFADLVDHRGNSLPQTIKSPRVIPRARTQNAVYVVAAESPEQFVIARDPNAAGPVMTDLMIIEMGD